MEAQKDKIEVYKREIIARIETSNDIDYIIAVYSFVKAYPEKTNKSR